MQQFCTLTKKTIGNINWMKTKSFKRDRFFFNKSENLKKSKICILAIEVFAE